MEAPHGVEPAPGTRWLREADAYLKIAVNNNRNARRFDNALIREILALAAESYWVGLFRNRGRVPLAHTLGGMAREAAAFVTVPGELVERLDRMDGSQNLCSLEPGVRNMPTDAEVAAMTAAVQAIRSIATVAPNRDDI